MHDVLKPRSRFDELGRQSVFRVEIEEKIKFFEQFLLCTSTRWPNGFLRCTTISMTATSCGAWIWPLAFQEIASCRTRPKPNPNPTQPGRPLFEAALKMPRRRGLQLAAIECPRPTQNSGVWSSSRACQMDGSGPGVDPKQVLGSLLPSRGHVPGTNTTILMAQRSLCFVLKPVYALCFNQT